MSKVCSNLVVVTAVAVSLSAFGQIKLAPVLSDHAVLQAGEVIPVWGSGGVAYRKMSCSIAGKTVWTYANSQVGDFRFFLPPLKAGGPYELVVSNETGGATFVVHDVMVGEVWLASGQSNMQWAMKNASPRYEGKNDFVRVFRGSKWDVMETSAVAEHSAIGSFFGDALQRARGGAVGVLDLAVGGTYAACWMPRGAVRSCPPARKWCDDFEMHQGDADRWEKPPAFEFDEPERSRLEKSGYKSPWPAPRRMYRFGADRNFRPYEWFEAWLAPVTMFPIRGAIWYQGESEAMDTMEMACSYEEMLSALIASWRQLWGNPNMPFCVVQLAGYGSSEKDGFKEKCRWAEVRDAQLRVSQNVPGVGMVSAIDVGERENIHPKNKIAVANRLCNWALGAVYGKKVGALTGPRFLGASVREDGKVRVRFTDADGGLVADAPVTCVFMRGETGDWKKAEAVVDGEELVVSSAEVPSPVEVRYAWDNFPVGATLRNKQGYPASPFRWRKKSNGALGR